MSKNSGGEVTYEIVADDSQLESDLNEAGKKVEKSAKKTAKKSEDAEKESAEVKKSVKEDVTKKNEQENDKQEKDDDDSYQNREESAKSHGSKLSSIASGTAKAIGAGMLAAGTAIAGVSAAAVKSANDIDQAMNQYIASTGKSTEETERYKKVMEDIYTNNYGDSFEDIGEAMASITQNLGDLDDTSLQTVTESAFALRDTFGYEIPESTRAAKAMMDNFGTSGEEAMNLIAAGAQNGLDYSGELLDSISEYSVQFAKVGLDADDMFKVFQKGAESGAFNLDKVGDAVKEFSIRAIDGSDTTIDGFKRIGLNADEMAAKFSAGGDTAKQAFQETIAALASMEDPFIRNVFTGNWRGAWENVKQIFSNAVSGLATIFKAPINAIVDGWNGLAGSLGSVTIPDWVPGIGGGSWSLPKMHRMKIGMDYVPYDLYPAYLDEGEWVLTKEEADVLRSYGGLEGMIGMIDRSAPSVNVSVQGQSKDFDYEKFGRATVDAMIAAGIGFKCDDREFARLIKDLIDYV